MMNARFDTREPRPFVCQKIQVLKPRLRKMFLDKILIEFLAASIFFSKLLSTSVQKKIYYFILLERLKVKF